MADHSENDALYRVIVSGKSEHLRRLTVAGADINSKYKHHTCLGLAIMNGHVDLARKGLKDSLLNGYN